jgi:translation initiation factor 5
LSFSTARTISGSFTEHQLRQTLDKFIEKYVLCPKCKLPLIIAVEKDKINYECNSCGSKSSLDNKHSVAKLIIKNPPTSSADIDRTKYADVVGDSKIKEVSEPKAKKSKKDKTDKEKKPKKEKTKKKIELSSEDNAKIDEFKEEIENADEYDLKSDVLWETIKFFREKFLEVIEINSDENVVSEFIYNMIKK